jgi:Lung seven transmembrane receptor
MSNTFGYLSADVYPMLRFYGIMTLVYLFIDAVWAFLCVKYFTQLILLHHFLSMILIQQTVQSIFYLIEYWVTNANGTLLFSFVFINILFNVSRNTFGRVLTLLVSLGTGILAPMEIPSHKIKLIILSVAYFIANIAYLIAVYVNRTQLH